MDMEEAFSRIDLSALSIDEQEGFKVWLNERSHMQSSIINAWRRGQSVKAFLHTFRKQSEYLVRIEE